MEASDKAQEAGLCAQGGGRVEAAHAVQGTRARLQEKNGVVLFSNVLDLAPFLMSAPSPRRLDASLVTRVLALNPACRHLNLSRNSLASAAPGEEDVLAPLADLLQLNLSSNALRALGPEFSALTQLQVLDVSRNQMCVLGVAGWRRGSPPPRGPVSFSHRALTTTHPTTPVAAARACRASAPARRCAALTCRTTAWRTGRS